MSPDQDQSPTSGCLGELTDADFVARWCEIVGEPPSILLEDRHEMIAILVAASGSPDDTPAADEDAGSSGEPDARLAA